MKIRRRSNTYEVFTAQPGSPANGLSNIIRLSDNETTIWFDEETTKDLLTCPIAEYDKKCAELFLI